MSTWTRDIIFGDYQQYHRDIGGLVCLTVRSYGSDWCAWIITVAGQRDLTRAFNAREAAQTAVEQHALKLLRGAIADLTGERDMR